MGVIWAPESPTWSVYVDVSVFFLVPLKRSEKATQSRPNRSLFGGGRHGSSVVNSGPNCAFWGRVVEQAPFLYNCWVHFGLHFGVILGAQFATILFFGRPRRQQGPPNRYLSLKVVFVWIFSASPP